MSWPGFYALNNAWLLLLLLPLVILYFLKLKRPKLEVSSLALWQQVINDQRVNSPFQRFKRNLLLLLQLMLLGSLILAAMQPFLKHSAKRARYVPVLIDCSASMAAVDENGVTRLDAVKSRIEKLIDDLLPDQQLSLISFGSSGRRLTSFTDNKRMLREALKRLQPNDVVSELEGPLRLTQALTRTVPIETVLVYSDGNVPDTIDFELPFEINYQRVPAGSANIGITALNARRLKAGQWNVFVRLQASNHAVAGKVELFQDGTLISEDYASLEPEAAQRLVFRVEGRESTQVQVRLTPDGPDSLSNDNSAGIHLPTARPLAVYCPASLAAFRHALQALRDVEIYPAADDSPAGRSRFDLLISDAAPTEGYDANVKLLFGHVPDALEKMTAINPGAATVVDWRRNAPLLQHVQLNQVLFSDEPTSFPNVADADYEALGFEILAVGRDAPLILKRRTDAEITYYLLFHPNRSTLPYRIGFPILVSNVVDIALREAQLSQVGAARTGVLPPQQLDRVQRTYTVSEPNLRQFEVTSNDQGVVRGIAANYVGRYSLRSDAETKHVDAALLSTQESSLRSVPELQFRELSVDEAREPVQNDRPLWPWLAMIGFGLLLGEWWYFNRRPAQD